MFDCFLFRLTERVFKALFSTRKLLTICVPNFEVGAPFESLSTKLLELVSALEDFLKNFLIVVGVAKAFNFSFWFTGVSFSITNGLLRP